MNNRKLDLDISTLIYEYLNNDNKIFLNKFEGFIKENYYKALECLDETNNKEEIIFYTKIKTVFMIFSSLASAEDDYDEVLRIFAIKKDYFPLLETLYSARYITHTKLAQRLGKTSQALSDYVKKMPDLGLFIRERGEGTTYYLTNKGKKLVERARKEFKFSLLEEENKRLKKDFSSKVIMMNSNIPMNKDQSELNQKNSLLTQKRDEFSHYQMKSFIKGEGKIYGFTI